jgi:hypothetical protein
MMEEIRQAIKEYGHDLTYNMDESGYYWKMKPDRSLSTFVAYCTCVFGFIQIKFRRLISLISDDVVIVVPQGKKANLTEFS